MWLLNTSTGELKFFNKLANLRYAILSHVWREGHEESFEDLQALQAQFISHESTPRARASAKIRNCCIYAERAGYEWVWIDTCCINKTSSTELSEAINSMYAWYAHAAVCYAFLDDARDKEDPCALDSTFRGSRWWTRGWTLQELVAPHTVVFLSESWRIIGTKHSLSHLVEEISGVDREVLVHDRSVDDVSVARRMSWAAMRHTTREEDRAYSLMGLFGVNMPTIYGEGPRAFTRLQEEILKHIPDQSIFAWGSILDNYPFACKCFATGSDDAQGSFAHIGVSSQDMQAMLAPSPVDFAAAGRIRPIQIAELAHRLGISLSNPHYLTTSYGIRTQLPILLPRAGLTHTTPTNVSIAVLACEHEDHSLVLLFLRSKDGMQDEYYVGDVVDVHDARAYFRIAYQDGAQEEHYFGAFVDVHNVRACFRAAFLAASATSLIAACNVRDVYVHSGMRDVHVPSNSMRDVNMHSSSMRNMHMHSSVEPARSLESIPVQRGPAIHYSFGIPKRVFGRLRSAGFELCTQRAVGRFGLKLKLIVLPGLDVSAISRTPRVTSVTFRHKHDRRESFTLMIGIGCICQLAQERSDAFWIDLTYRSQLRQQKPARLGASEGCTRRHLTYAPVEFATIRGRLRVTVSPWGRTSPMDCVAWRNHIVDIDFPGQG